MTTTIKLTDTQREVLKLATQRPDGNCGLLPHLYPRRPRPLERA